MRIGAAEKEVDCLPMWPQQYRNGIIENDLLSSRHRNKGQNSEARRLEMANDQKFCAKRNFGTHSKIYVCVTVATPIAALRDPFRHVLIKGQWNNTFTILELVRLNVALRVVEA